VCVRSRARAREETYGSELRLKSLEQSWMDPDWCGVCRYEESCLRRSEPRRPRTVGQLCVHGLYIWELCLAPTSSGESAPWQCFTGIFWNIDSTAMAISDADQIKYMRSIFHYPKLEGNSGIFFIPDVHKGHTTIAWSSKDRPRKRDAPQGKVPHDVNFDLHKNCYI
jgi:hypothetical protein